MQSLTIPDTFRNPNGYTADEIREALQGVTGSRMFSFRYDLLDTNNEVIRALDTVKSCKISQNWLADIKRTASFSLRAGTVESIDYLSNRIKPWIRLKMPAKAIPDPDSVLPPTTQNPPLFGGLIDNFDSAAMDADWASYSGGTANVGGRLRVPATPSNPSAVSNATWVLTGSQVAAEINTVPSATGGTLVTFQMTITSTTPGTDLTIEYRLVGGGLDNKLRFLNNVGGTDGAAVNIDYDPFEHRWWRIRHASGTVYFETSATGFPGTWQIQRSLASPSWVTTGNNLTLRMRASRDAGDTDYAEVDNVNLASQGTETSFMPQQVWFNNFNGTPGVTGEAVTKNNSARHGNALDDVLGTVVYDGTYSADGGKSAKLGDDSGTSGGTIVARLRTALTDWSMRFYYRMASGATLTVKPDGATINTANDITIDTAGGTYMLGTVSIPSAYRPNLVGQLVKVEVITTEILTIYRVFWTNPTGDSPDYVTSESNVGRDPLITATVSGGGSSTPPVWFDNLEITEPRSYEPFTDDSVNYVEWPQGVFMLSSPQRQTDEAGVVNREIQGYDLAQILEEDQVGDRYSTANLLRVNDNFTRSLSGSWGTSADGTTWLHTFPANTFYGVDASGYGWIRIGDGSGNIRICQAGNTNQEILVDSEVYCRTGVSTVPTGASLISGLIFRLYASSDYYRVRVLWNTDSSVQIQVTTTNGGVVNQLALYNTGLTFTAGEIFNVRAQCIGHTMRGKIWKNGTAEPTAWQVEDEVPLANQIGVGYTGVSGSSFSGLTSVNPEVRYDLFQLNPNPANTYTGVIEYILTEANLPSRITANNKVIPTVKEWEAGTSKRVIVNELLAAINYESISFDEDGYAVIKPYITPQDRGSEYTYADDELSVMYPEVMQEYDLFTVPNRWILTVGDPDRDPITVTFTNNDPASPTSTIRRGRVITSFNEEQDASDEATLIDKASRMAFESSQIFEATEFETGLMPIHSGNDVYTIQYDPMSINGQYSEVSWDMELKAGARMQHRARRVISLTPGSDSSIINDSVDVTGALDAGNIAAGVTAITPVANKPTSIKVTGLNLQGRGPVKVLITAEGTTPGSQIKEVTVSDITAYGFTLWIYRTNTTSTNIHWFAIRGA